MLERKARQLHDPVGIRPIYRDRQGLQAFKNCGYIGLGQSFTAIRHHEAVGDFVGPKKGDERFVRIESRKYFEIVRAIILVLQIPAEG